MASKNTKNTTETVDGFGRPLMSAENKVALMANAEQAAAKATTPVERKAKVEASKARIREANQMAQTVTEMATRQLQEMAAPAIAPAEEPKTVTIPDRRKGDRRAQAPAEDLNAKAQAATERAVLLQARNGAIVAAILAGKPRKQVAQEYGVSPSRVHEVLVAAGYKKQDEKNAERDRLIVEDAVAGKTPREIAKEIGLSESRVRLILAGATCQPVPKTEAGKIEEKAEASA